MREPESDGAEEDDDEDAGIGITFKKLDSGMFFVRKIVSGGPAARMGTQIQVQDILYKVDNAEVKGWDYKELANRIKGPAGSIVTMHFRRSGKPPHKAIVTRGFVSDNPVPMRGKSSKGSSSVSSSVKRSIPSKFAAKDGECGIGFALKPDGDKGFYISKILPDSPAMECGRLHVGDRVRKIDGHRIDGMSLDRVKTLILGEEGSAMEIVVTDQQVGFPSALTCHSCLTFAPGPQQPPHHPPSPRQGLCQLPYPPCQTCCFLSPSFCASASPRRSW